MNKLFYNTNAVGFDLDGTFYETKGEIDNRIRTKLAEKILEINPNFLDVDSARDYFEKRYAEGNSSTRILKEAGYGEYASTMRDWCLANADILDLIKPNKNLVSILERMSEKYELNLITSSPKQLSLNKLERLGITAEIFYLKFFDSRKSDGESFKEMISFSNFPAEEHVYIGDSLISDILPAKRLGMKTIAVDSNINEASITINNINEIENLLL
jgi:FMN phosphatase YigB (HAD superfamily)